MSSRSRVEWESWYELRGPLKRTWAKTIRPRIFLVFVACVAAIDVAALGYWIGTESGISEDRAAQVQGAEFQSAFEDARREALIREILRSL